MSTYQQKYSIENQAAAIAAYASERKIEIVKTYVDKGRSGLRINSRNDPQKLIADVQERKADFDVILVYDVSRWGRFQDVDESAYYEFIRKKSRHPGALLRGAVQERRRLCLGDHEKHQAGRRGRL